jgi:hypothetical protein
MLSRLSVSCDPGCRLRLWYSSASLRISPLHAEFYTPLSHSSQAVSDNLPRFSHGAFMPHLPNRLRALYAQ